MEEAFLQRFGFICNPEAGGASQAGELDSAIDSIRAQGHDAERYEHPSGPAEAAAQALKDGCSVVVACGGDGTVSAVASAISGTAVTLGVFPLGTLNHFAHDLGIKDFATAKHVLAGANTRQIDAASVNGRLFVNNSGVGLYPAMVLERDALRSLGVPKWPACLFASAKALKNLPFLRLRIECDGKKLAVATAFLFVGNNEYRIEGLSAGSRERLDEGKLAIFSMRRSSLGSLIRIVFRALAGTIKTERDLTRMTASRLIVRTKRPAKMHVSLDGELARLATPLEYLSLPGALRVLAP